MPRFSDDKPDIETSSDSYQGRFDGPAGRYFLETQEHCVLELLTDSVTSVLDVGGGHGQLTGLFLDRGFAITAFGSDEICHHRLRAKYGEDAIEYVTGNLLDLPFTEGQFDLVVAIRLISHMAAWERLIFELCRVARGSVIIDYPSVLSLNVLTPVMFRLKKRIEGNTRTYASFSQRRLADCFQRNGFDVREARPQFLLPMVVHRALKGRRFLQVAEAGFRRIALTDLLGSPVLLRADRDAGGTSRIVRAS